MTALVRNARVRDLPGIAILVLIVFLAGASMATAQTAVTTYHNDNYRTGWNSTETVLTPANVGSSSFGLLFKVKLDDQVDAQPLVVPGVNITAGKFPGTHDVVYVVTENDTVYAIDATASTVLLTQSLGSLCRCRSAAITTDRTLASIQPR